MNEARKNNLNIAISLLCILISFFLGYMYAQREGALRYMQKSEEKIYIDITRSSKNITIKQAPENVYFRVDGTLLQSGSIDLK